MPTFLLCVCVCVCGWGVGGEEGVSLGRCSGVLGLYSIRSADSGFCMSQVGVRGGGLGGGSMGRYIGSI